MFLEKVHNAYPSIIIYNIIKIKKIIKRTIGQCLKGIVQRMEVPKKSMAENENVQRRYSEADVGDAS